MSLYSIHDNDEHIQYVVLAEEDEDLHDAKMLLIYDLEAVSEKKSMEYYDKRFTIRELRSDTIFYFDASQWCIEYGFADELN